MSNINFSHYEMLNNTSLHFFFFLVAIHPIFYEANLNTTAIEFMLRFCVSEAIVLRNGHLTLPLRFKGKGST